MVAAARELLSLGPIGLQLTPGCVPTRGFAGQLDEAGITTRTHQGFSFGARRSLVWDGLTLVCRSDSVHPPKDADLSAGFLAGAANGDFDGVVMETMYPGHCLGTGRELEQAMDMGMSLAVDVSHVHIQLDSGAMRPATWDRLQAYDHVDEVHVSSNDGRSDQHRPVSEATFGFDWATTKAATGTPVILESYMHRQSETERHEAVHSIINAIEQRTPLIRANAVAIGERSL